MKSPNGSTVLALQILHRSIAYTADLCAAIIVGVATDRSHAMRLLPAALRELRARTQAAIEALEEDTP